MRLDWHHGPADHLRSFFLAHQRHRHLRAQGLQDEGALCAPQRSRCVECERRLNVPGGCWSSPLWHTRDVPSCNGRHYLAGDLRLHRDVLLHERLEEDLTSHLDVSHRANATPAIFQCAECAGSLGYPERERHCMNVGAFEQSSNCAIPPPLNNTTVLLVYVLVDDDYNYFFIRVASNNADLGAAP